MFQQHNAREILIFLQNNDYFYRLMLNTEIGIRALRENLQYFCDNDYNLLIVISLRISTIRIYHYSYYFVSTSRENILEDESGDS